MSGVWHLASRRVVHTPGISVVTALCIATTLALPLATALVAEWYARALTSRAASTPLVVGAKGNTLDLTLASLYWRRQGNPGLSMAAYRELGRVLFPQQAVAVPLHVRFTTRGVPLVATTTEYYEQRDLRLAQGTRPLLLGDAVLGSAAARRLGVEVGAQMFSDQLDAFDIARPPALRMRVAGILAPAPGGSPDDDAVFVDLKTAWVLEGLAHGHADAARAVPDRLVLDRAPGAVVISEELIEQNEVRPDNLGSFHLHAGEETLPLTAVLVFPASTRDLTIIKARLGNSKTLQAAVPVDVVAELLAIVGRVRAILDIFFIILGASTIALLALVAILSARLRARESQTLHRVGCSRWFVFRVQAVEFTLVGTGGAVVALLATVALYELAPGLVWLVQIGAGSG